MERETLHTSGPDLKVQRIILGCGEKLDRVLPTGFKSWIIVSSGIAILKTDKNEIVLHKNDRISIDEGMTFSINNRETGSLCLIETEYDDRN